MDGLAPVDGLALVAVAAKAAGYGAALLAMGGALFVLVFRRDADDATLRCARQMAALAAAIGLAVLALRFGIRAARISGLGFTGATDPMMLSFVWSSPLGTAAIWRALGEAAILVILLPGALGRTLPTFGAVAVAISYAQVGHTLGNPRALLAPLLVLHLLAVAFWIGALAPLHRAARSSSGAALLERFGRIAGGVVALLAVGGVGLGWLLSGGISALFGTAYGLGLLLKVGAVAALLGLAALNRWRLVPALRAGQAGAAPALRRSIATEGAIVLLILIATAAITTITTPPANL
ncbi:copper resistance D family protein [Jannaschia sp. KMU-145]|uniref:copper resistance D family protein n=1 Tax=Jannaschia halovivens TaxID=3388667 RepID=UPI00396AF3FE